MDNCKPANLEFSFPGRVMAARPGQTRQSESKLSHTIVCIYCTELGSRSTACPQEDLGNVQMSSLSLSLSPSHYFGCTSYIFLIL